MQGPLILCLGLALSCAVAVAHPNPDTQFEAPNDMPPTASVTDQTPVSVDAILRFLSMSRHDDVAVSMLIGLIRMHGLSFRPAPEVRAQISAAGASDGLVRAIETARTNPISSVPKEGFLTVVCQPVDCVVELDGKEMGPSKTGQPAHLILPIGRAGIRIKRAGYEPDHSEEVVSIRAGETVSVLFKLSPTRAALEEAGGKRFRAMVAALGEETRPSSSMPVLRAVGTIYLFANSQQASAWSTVATIRGPDSAVFTVTRAGREYELTLREGKLFWKPPPRDKEARELEDGLMTAVNYQHTKLTAQMGNPRFRFVGQPMVSGELDSGEFRANSDSESYVVKLDAESRPIEVNLESMGLDTSTRVLYSEYIAIGAVPFPRHTVVVLPGGQYGIEIRYDRIEEVAPAKAMAQRKRLRMPR